MILPLAGRVSGSVYTSAGPEIYFGCHRRRNQDGNHNWNNFKHGINRAPARF
jgi:hypothetical protein